MYIYNALAGSIAKDDDNSSGTTGPGWDITSLLRRPYLQIVVLFASDPKVMAYARSVQVEFANVGVDSWVQTELTPTELDIMPPGSVTSQSGHRWVKPEHLVTVINCTKADSLIVLGDRNMRNDSCQVCVCQFNSVYRCVMCVGGCMYTCVRVCLYVYVYMNVHLHVDMCKGACMFRCAYQRECVSILVYVFVPMIFMFVCIRAYAIECVYIEFMNVYMLFQNLL
jgi:hypothetical protein